MTPEEFIKTAEHAAALATIARREADCAREFMQSRLETGWDYKEDKAREQAKEALKSLKVACEQLNMIVSTKIEY